MYQCDLGHEWTVSARQGALERVEDTFCAEGHEAVTCREEPPADRVQLLLRPAARIIDSVTGRVRFADRYVVVLLSRDDAELCSSEKQYAWDDAVALAALFKECDERQAVELWKERAL